jgi:hypothetical protein
MKAYTSEAVMSQKIQRMLAAVSLAVGAALGMAGTFAQSDALRGLLWGIDGISLVIASSILAVIQIRDSRDLLAAGFMVFAIGQGLILSTAAVDPAEAAPTFGAGAGLWAAGLVLASVPGGFPLIVRLLGIFAAVLFAIVATQIFFGSPIDATTSPLPALAYPILVATMIGWIWWLLRAK